MTYLLALTAALATAGEPAIHTKDVDRFYAPYDSTAAEFVAELTAGSVAYSQLTADTRGHEKEIETAFVREEDQKDLSHWLYNSTAAKHGDLGYWVGYRIVKCLLPEAQKTSRRRCARFCR